MYNKKYDEAARGAPVAATHTTAKQKNVPSKSPPKKGGRCWEGYEPVPGKKPYAKGSCAKK